MTNVIHVMEIKILHSISLKPAGASIERDAPKPDKDEQKYFFERLAEKNQSR